MYGFLHRVQSFMFLERSSGSSFVKLNEFFTCCVSSFAIVVVVYNYSLYLAHGGFISGTS